MAMGAPNSIPGKIGDVFYDTITGEVKSEYSRNLHAMFRHVKAVLTTREGRRALVKNFVVVLTVTAVALTLFLLWLSRFGE